MHKEVVDKAFEQCKTSFLSDNNLTEAYWKTAQQWFIPLVQDILAHQKSADHPLIIGLNGAQGSGKSTLTDLIVRVINHLPEQSAIGFSIDDFYLSKDARIHLAKTVHPLLLTRGVPGTHDTNLLHDVLTKLQQQSECTIPRFNKATDDLFPKKDWVKITHSFTFIILEGWCVGSQPTKNDSLKKPINRLEQDFDSEGIWRRFVNQQLSGKYQQVFAMMDYLIMLKAPSFNSVDSWRKEQEHKMRLKLETQGYSSANVGMSDTEIETFIQYYQRITQDNIARMPEFCDYLFSLDDKRDILSCSQR